MPPLIEELSAKMREHLGEAASRAVAEAIAEVYERLREGELAKLREAQERTERSLNALAEEVRALTAQVRALAEDQRRMWEELRALAEEQRKMREELRALAAQVRTLSEEMAKLTRRVNELAEAQRKMEDELRELGYKVEELTEAQRRNEREIASLVYSIRELRKEYGGLADSVGFMLEDRAIKSLPGLLKERLGIEVRGRLIRTFIPNSLGKMEEINIFGEGVRDGVKVVIIGEGKSQLSKKHVMRFLKKLDRLSPVLEGEIVPVMVTYRAEPEVVRYAESKGITLFMSYEL